LVCLLHMLEEPWGKPSPISPNWNFNPPFQAKETPWADFDNIWHCTSHNHPKPNATISSYLYSLLSFGCRTHTHARTHIRTPYFIIHTWYNLNKVVIKTKKTNTNFGCLRKLWSE
jgi:hypothetical protein